MISKDDVIDTLSEIMADAICNGDHEDINRTLEQHYQDISQTAYQTMNDLLDSDLDYKEKKDKMFEGIGIIDRQDEVLPLFCEDLDMFDYVMRKVCESFLDNRCRQEPDEVISNIYNWCDIYKKLKE